MNYDKIMEIHWKCHTKARRQQCVDVEYLINFAELIVRECAVIATEGNSDKIASDILEHFEVE